MRRPEARPAPQPAPAQPVARARSSGPPSAEETRRLPRILRRAWARLAERSSSAATSSSGPAVAGRDARHGDRDHPRSVASANDRCAASVPPPTPHGRRLSGRADDGDHIVPIASRPVGVDDDAIAIPSRVAARHTSTGSPTGSAAASSKSAAYPPPARRAGDGNCPRSASTPDASATRTRRQLRRVNPRGNSRTPTDYRASQRRAVRGHARPTAPAPPSPTRRAHHRRADPRERASASLELSARVAGRHQQRDRLSQQPPRDEHERLRRC